MWKFIAVLLCATAIMPLLGAGAQRNPNAAIGQGGNYHYPVPAGKVLQEVPQLLHTNVQYEQQQQQQYQQAQPQLQYQQPQVQYQQQQQQQYQQQQQQQQRYANRAYQYPGATAATAALAQHQLQQQQQQLPVARQFSSPALESAAFTMALRSQGLSGNAGAPSAAAAASGSKLLELRSLNIKLPVPIGVMPINAAPLPIQAGTPYSVLRGVNSYGTVHPQR